MKIYDENWNELAEPDLTKGRLEPARRLVAHHEAQPGVPAEYGWRVLEGTGELHPGGLRQRVVVTPAMPAQEAWDEYEECQVYKPYTAGELAAMDAPTLEERVAAVEGAVLELLLGDVADV